MARRVYCAGAIGYPCPAHAWWHYEGNGRPRERCNLCGPVHESVRRRENNQNFKWKRRALASSRSSAGEGA
jgi:hypothetical protein